MDVLSEERKLQIGKEQRRQELFESIRHFEKYKVLCGILKVDSAIIEQAGKLQEELFGFYERQFDIKD